VPDETSDGSRTGPPPEGGPDEAPSSVSPDTRLADPPPPTTAAAPGTPLADDVYAPESDPFAEADDANAEGPAPPTIFVTDPTVEAARVEWALRARGYEVIDVPLAMLAGRVTVQRPHLVLLDVDAPGALEIAARVRQLPGASGVHLIYAGVAGKTFESARDAFAHEGSGFFARPIDVDALVAKVDSLLGVESSRNQAGEVRIAARHSSHPPAPPPSLRAPPSPMPPRPDVPPSLRAPSEPPEPSGAPTSDPLRVPEPKGWSTRAAEQRLSPDLERLLREAEARVVGPPSQRGPESIPQTDDELLSPEDEVEAVLPAEILASLDEPLDVEIDDEEGGSSETGGTPHNATTGRAAPERVKTSAREHTHGGEAEPEPSALTTSAGSRARPAPASAGTSAGTSGGSALTSAARIEHEPRQAVAPEPSSPPPVRRDASTPRPPRRALAAPPPETNHGERSLSSPEHEMPMPALDHPPPLAPQTSRPPAQRPEPEAARPEPAVAFAPRAITSADEALRALASAVATRVTGVLRFDEANGIRRIVMQDGDIVTAASSVEGESLLGYLVGRGDLPADVARKLEGRVPPFGRLAGAALVAHGHLHQDQLWDVLQAHAAWLLTRTAAISRGRVAFEPEPPQRLRGEPPVFGGTPGPALVLEIVRRSVPPNEALARIGGRDVRFTPGERHKLLDECGLDDDDDALVRSASGVSLREILDTRGEDAIPVLYALAALGVVHPLVGIRPGALASPPPQAPEVEIADPLRDAELDDAAVRARISARRALVEDGDYFAILGVPREATGYEIKRAYLDLRKALDPQRVMRPSLLDISDDLKIVLGVLDEAYDVLKDATRRERYRRAITHEPPARA